MTAAEQVGSGRDAKISEATSSRLHEAPTASRERTETGLAVRWLSRVVNRRLLAGRRREREVLDVGAALISALHLHDGLLGDHAKRTQLLAEKVASELGLNPESAWTTSQAASLHDIGKICVPGHILTKPGTLDEDEWRIMRRHPEIGAEILSKLGVSERLASAIRAHHERFDGRGYPAGLSGEEIPVEARIVSVVDAYDAMTSDRHYRKAVKPEEALEEVKRNTGAQFCPDAAGALLGGVRARPTG